MVAVLFSQHQELERIDANKFGELCCMAGRADAEDLIQVIENDGQTKHWCDQIEFLEEI